MAIKTEPEEESRLKNLRESLIGAADVAATREPRYYEAAAKWSSWDCGIIVFPDKAINNTPTTVTALLVKGETPTVAKHWGKKAKPPSVVCSGS